jgi:nucleoside-diphosphate-sugar epimerase
LRTGARVVHLSTVAVFGRQEGSLTEDSPVAPGSDAYGSSKLVTEQICAEYGKRGLPITVLRPTIVYGPYSDLWTVEFAQRLSAGEPFFPERYTRGICNLVYVDDVVKAVIMSLDNPKAIGQTFIVNGEERPTWNEYFHALNDALGLTPIRSASALRAQTKAALMMPVRKTAKFVLKRFQPIIMRIYQRSNLAKKLMRNAETSIRNSPTTGEFELYSRRVAYEGQKARDVLAFRPTFSMRDGVELSVAWLRDYQYL